MQTQKRMPFISNPGLSLLVLILILVILGTLGGFFSYHRNMRFAEEDTLAFVGSLEALMHPQLSDLAETVGDGAPFEESASLADALQGFVKNHDRVSFTFIVIEKDGQYLYLSNSEEGMRPGTIPASEAPVFLSEALSGETPRVVYTGGGEWGNRITAAAPVRDAESGRALAAFGIGYAARDWYAAILQRMTSDLIIIAVGLLLLLLFFLVLRQHSWMTLLKGALATDEELFREVLNQAPIGIVISQNIDLLPSAIISKSRYNPMFEEIIGRSGSQMDGIRWLDITHPDDIDATVKYHKSLFKQETGYFTLEKRYIRPDGSIVWVNAKVTAVMHGDKHQYSLIIVEDITARKLAEQALTESERGKAVLLSHLPGMAFRCRADDRWTMEFVSEGCRALTGYAADAFVSDPDFSFVNLVLPECRDQLSRKWALVLQDGRSFRHEFRITGKDGKVKWVMALGQGISNAQGAVIAVEGILIDINAQKEDEAQILYLSTHDRLTGLYNRLHMERIQKSLEDEKCMPLSVAVSDIDGTHLINEIYGIEEGDRLIVRVARMIEQCVRPGDILVRSGSDEFTLIMPNTSAAEAERVVRRIGAAVDVFNRRETSPNYELSLSVGCGTAVGAETSPVALIKTALENMHYHKLLMRKSAHSSILSSATAMMLARSRETEAHCERLNALAVRLGNRLGLRQKAMDELRLYAVLHDIGKIGVDDRILNKPGKLTDDEWAEMKKHSEIGYRIAVSTPELKHVANYILCHHERWDGRGYPKGLAGKEIPLLSRMLLLVDAYDAMTEDRVYRKAMSKEQAISEIEQGAGSQFDPALAEMFVEMLREENA